MKDFKALIIIAIIILMQLTINNYLYGYNQPEYCHAHYANGTVACHKMPMNMTTPVSNEMPMNMTMPVSNHK